MRRRRGRGKRRKRNRTGARRRPPCRAHRSRARHARGRADRETRMRRNRAVDRQAGAATTPVVRYTTRTPRPTPATHRDAPAPRHGAHTTGSRRRARSAQQRRRPGHPGADRADQSRGERTNSDGRNRAVPSVAGTTLRHSGARNACTTRAFTRPPRGHVSRDETARRGEPRF